MAHARSCAVCAAPIHSPIYESHGHTSMTTMLRLYRDSTVVWFCDRCGHLQTDAIVPPDDYYAHQYSILAESDEEDLLYKVVHGRQVFQVEHRVETLLKKVPVRAGARVLDFGCAKGAVVERLRRTCPDMTAHFFDVTDRYLSFWERAIQSDGGPAETKTRRDRTAEASPSLPRWAVHDLPSVWRHQFDLVCSFYVLEHVTDPVATVQEMTSLLRPGGTVYLLVPNAQANPADMIVADHLQHFSESSLREVMHRAGLELVDIDSTSHDAAFIAAGRKVDQPATLDRPSPESICELREHYIKTGAMWSAARDRVQSFESAASQGRPACIYGAGFYGNFVASCLKHPENVMCFVDQNRFLHGRTTCGKPIVAPDQLARNIEVVYVGLNPAVARTVMAGIPDWQTRPFQTFYL